MANFQVQYFSQALERKTIFQAAIPNDIRTDIAGMTEQLSEDNFIVQLVPGGHDFTVWYLGFYNFARLFAGIE